MRKFKIATLAAVSIIGIGAIGGAAVKASASTNAVKSASPVAASLAKAGAPATDSEATGLPDTDNVQQGDQTTPDTATLTSSQSSSASQQANEAAGEKAGTETANAAESDGPGGHADPAGANVDHQFEGQE